MINIDKAQGTVAGIFDSIAGLSKTDGISPIGLIGRKSTKERPGFLPPEDAWYGDLLEAHPDYIGERRTHNDISTKERFDSSLDPGSNDYYSTRDQYLLFNDSSTDYFKHGLHILYNKTPIRSDKNSRESWDGFESGTPQRLSQVLSNTRGEGGTPYENNDPVIFGFELVMDSVTSPLLNGSVEDFIDQFSRISEIAVRKLVIADFKKQFTKLFKIHTNGAIQGTKEGTSKKTISIPLSDYSNTDSNIKYYQPGKAAYMSYYLKKIEGLGLLMESNTADKKKYLAEYRKDVLKFTFNEDVSLSMGTLAHLYKLLYWSKPNGKNIIPENLLRFNCDIIISEVRNLNRVRKAITSGNLEVIKDNLSRHIYSLKECQFWFDQTPHDGDIDMSSASKEFDSYTVTMDFKFATTKFERWTPDGQGFGQYVGYNNGSIWKIGNPGARTTDNTGAIRDISFPKFYTIGTNTFDQNGVLKPIIFDEFDEFKNIATSSTIETLKKSSDTAIKRLAKNLLNTGVKELKAQINIRTKLLNATLDKIRNITYSPRRMREPRNIYKGVYKYDPLDFANEGLSTQFFFDVHNSIKSFGGEAIGNNIVGNTLFGGNSHNV